MILKNSDEHKSIINVSSLDAALLIDGALKENSVMRNTHRFDFYFDYSCSQESLFASIKAICDYATISSHTPIPITVNIFVPSRPVVFGAKLIIDIEKYFLNINKRLVTINVTLSDKASFYAINDEIMHYDITMNEDESYTIDIKTLSEYNKTSEETQPQQQCFLYKIRSGLERFMSH